MELFVRLNDIYLFHQFELSNQSDWMWSGAIVALPLYGSVLIPVNICTLILLQTDSSPSMSLAQLAKVVSL